MSFEKMLDHTCDIYHILETEKSPGYNLPTSPSFSYPEKPDIREQKCHFGVRFQSTTVVQTAPANLLDERIKLTFPIGTDIRINDKIIDCRTGLEYTAEQPKNIRGHHIFVYVKRTGGQKPL